MSAKSILKRICRDQRGATAVEYALILVMIFFAVISAVRGVASQTTGLWAIVSSKSAEAHGTN